MPRATQPSPSILRAYYAGGSSSPLFWPVQGTAGSPTSVADSESPMPWNGRVYSATMYTTNDPGPTLVGVHLGGAAEPSFVVQVTPGGAAQVTRVPIRLGFEAGQRVSFSVDPASDPGASYLTVAMELDGPADAGPSTVTQEPDPDPDPVGATARFTAAPASFDNRAAAWHQGLLGSTASGEYWRIPDADDDASGSYIWFTMDGGGVDPGGFVAELAGFTGHVVDLVGPQSTATQRATATRALSIAGLEIAGAGDEVTVAGAIGTCTVGGMHGATIRGAAGTQRMTPSFATNPLNEDGKISQSFTWDRGAAAPHALGMYLADTTTPVRIGIFLGGTAGGDGHAAATVAGEVLIPAGSPVGWTFVELPPESIADVTNGTVVRLVAKSNGLSVPGYISTVDLVGTDFADNLEILVGGSTDPNTPFEADLSGDVSDFSTPVYALMAVQYRSTDGSDTELRTRWGIQIEDPLDLTQTSSLTAPDAGGAELYVGAPPPPLLGMILHAYAIAWGATHTTQPRAFVAQGGSVGDAGGATVIWQDRTTGTTTDAWEEFVVPGNVPVDDAATLHWGVRNDVVTATFHFALNVNRETATPDENPSDFTDASEYEIFNSSDGEGVSPGAYETDPAIEIVSPVDPLTGFVANNQNYPGAYLVLRVPGSTVAME